LHDTSHNPSWKFIKISTLSDSIDNLVTIYVNESQSATFECELEGIKKNYFVKWIKDGKELINEQSDFNFTNSLKNPKFQIDPKSHKLTINAVKSSIDEGVYDCVMFNDKEEFIIKSKKRFELQVRGTL
jgi:hypothetical protein